MTSNQADSTDDGTDDRVDDGTEDGVDGGVDGGADLLPMIENILALVRTLPRHPRRLDEDGIRALARWLGTATGDVRAEVDPADPVEAMTFAARKLEEALPTVREAVTADGPRLPAALKAELVRLCRAAVLNALVGAPLDSIVPPADLVRLFVHTVEPPGHRAFDVVDLYDEPRPGELHIPDHREGPAAPEQPAPADPGDRRRGPGSSF